MNRNYRIISIEGNIGSGKSHLIEYLKKTYKNNKQIIFLDEPIEEWEKIKDADGITILEKFYADQEKYSFPFQMMAYISRLNILKKAIKLCESEEYKNKGMIYIFTERSLFTDKNVFAKMLYDSGAIEPINYQIYLSWFDSFIDDFKMDAIVYMNTSPDCCFKRIIKRDRQGETKISKEYIIKCHRYHLDMLNKYSDNCICKKQFEIDGNIDINILPSQMVRWISDIMSFVKSIA